MNGSRIGGTEIMKSEPVNLLVTIDKNYLFPLKVMLESYAQTHKGVKTNVYIAHASLELKDFSMLREVLRDTDITLCGIKITESWFKDIPVLERLSEESFYRLLAFAYLPSDVRRCLYLDPDIYIRKSLLPLYSMNMNGNLIAAASHIYGLNNRFNCARLGLWRQKRYVNSGVMLMDLDAIRKEFTIEDVLACLKKNVRILFFGDQDLSNILFKDRIEIINELIYNLDERTLRTNRKGFNISNAEQETAIVHYNGKYKPWLNGYKGLLNRFYPNVEEKGVAPSGNVWRRTKAIFKIMFYIPRKQKSKIKNTTQTEEIQNEKIIGY